MHRRGRDKTQHMHSHCLSWQQFGKHSSYSQSDVVKGHLHFPLPLISKIAQQDFLWLFKNNLLLLEPYFSFSHSLRFLQKSKNMSSCRFENYAALFAASTFTHDTNIQFKIYAVDIMQRFFHVLWIKESFIEEMYLVFGFDFNLNFSCTIVHNSFTGK